MPWTPQRRTSVFAAGGPPPQLPTGGSGGFSGGFGGGSGTNVGVSDPQLDEFVTGPFIQPPPGAATSGTSSLQRAFPERIGGNLVASPGMETPLLQHAMQGIGRIGAQPVALADTILGGALTKGATAVDEGIPVLGDLLGWGGEAIHNIFTLPAAIMNQQPSQVMAALWNKGDDTVITPELLAKNGLHPGWASQFKKNGLPVLGWLGITGDQLTIGELKQELEGRGFLHAEGDPALSISWEEFANQVNGDPLGSFKQGHASVNEDGVADFALQTLWQGVETLPLSIGFQLAKWGVGTGIGLAARMTGKGAQAIAHADEMDAAAAGVGALARGAGVTTPVWGFTIKNAARATGQVGDGAVTQMARDGVIDAAALGVEQGVAQLAAGTARGATMQAFAQYAKSKIGSVLYPNIPKLNPLQRYMVGQTTVRFGALGAEFGTGALENVIAGPEGTNVPIISDIHNFFEAVNNNTLVSDDMVFQTALSFATPIQMLNPTIRAATAPIRGAMNIGRAQTLQRSLGLLERDLGKGSIEALGGRQAAAIQLDRIVQTLAFEKAMRGLPAGIKAKWESLPEATLRMRLIHNTIRARADFMVRKGQITASDIVSKFRAVHENPIRTHYNADGSMFRAPALPFQTRLSSEAIIRRANAYAAASAGLTDPIIGMRTAVLGRAPRMAREDLDFAIQTIEDSAVDGFVDAQMVRDIFYETPGMLDDPFVSEGTHNFFVETMNPAKNDPVPVADLVGRLKELDPPTRDQLWHELNAREAAAGGVAHSGDTGPVSNGVARNIHSEETAKRFVLEADGRVKSLKKRRATLMEQYRSMFSKRGRYKPSQSDHNWEVASPEIARTMAVTQVGHFSQVSGKPRNYARGFDVPARRLGVIPEGDVAGMVEAARAVRREFPGADVRFTPSATHPGHLDVTGSYHFATEARAQAKAAELGVTAYFDSSKKIVPRVPPNPVILVPKPVMDAKIAEIVTAMPKLTPEQSVAAGELLRTMAQNYARYNGGSPLDYLDNMEFVRGGRRGSGALRQTDVLFADQPPVAPPTLLSRNRAELQPVLDQPAPPALQKAGMGDSSPLEWHTLDNGEDFAIPGGLDGEFSLWDAWRLRSQQVDPNLIPEHIRVPLYEKLFRSQQRELNNPVDVWNRIAFAHISPNMNLLANETGLASMRATSLKGIKQIAEMPLEDLYARLSAAGSASIPLRQQLRSLKVNAARFAENPNWFKIKAGENTLEYSERIMSVLDGAGMKVGNFSTMLADPLRHNRGTIDSHMIAILNRKNLLEPDVAARLKASSDAPIAPSTKLIPLKIRGKDNPAVPEHLRNLPWQRSDGKVATFDGDYRITSEALDRHLAVVHPDLPFASGGGQWYLWDMERGIVEPHTAIWPGAEKLAAMAPEAIGKAKGVIKAADYYTKTGKRQPFDPNEGVFWQLGDGGKTKGSIEWNAQQKAIIRGYESADLSTFVHEMGHQIRRDLHPEDQLIIEKHYGVPESRWTVKHEERFARDFERYLRDGRAPTEAIRDAFAKIATWMRDIYKTIVGTPLEAKISPEVRAIFDRALGKVDEAARIDMPAPRPTPKGFRPATLQELEAARAKSTRQEFLSPIDPDEFSTSQAFISEDGLTGGMVTAEGDMVGLFNAGGPKGAGMKAFDAQVEMGGYTLDAFDGFLPELYAKKGFAETGRMKFVDEFAPPGWNYAKYGRPDIVFMHRTGKNAPYKKSTTYFTDWDAAKAASRAQGRRLQAPRATSPIPEAEPFLFVKEDASLLAQREAMRQAVRDIDTQIGRTQADIREVRARAKALKGGMNSLDDSFTELNPDGTPRVTGADMRKVAQYTNWIRENYPQFEVEAGPRIMNLYEPDSSLLKNLMLENDATGNFLFSWGPFSRMHNAIKAATDKAISPVRGRIESGDTTSRIYETLMREGAKADEVKKFLDNVRESLANERTFGFSHEQIPLTRGINAMGARQLTGHAMSAFAKNEQFVAAFEKRYGGKGLERIYITIAESYNPAIRAIQRKIEQGGKVNRLQRLMESAYDNYHTAPGFSKLAVGTHALAKFIYPLVRFTLNPLYHVYNATESDIIGITQDGLRVKRGHSPTSAEVMSTVERGNFEAAAGRVGQQRRMESMGMDPALDAYTDELIRNATLDQTGVPFGYNSRRAAIMERQVDLRRPETIQDAVRQFTLEDPAVQAALKRYGGDIDDWVDGLTQDIYGIDKSGARQYIGDLVKQEGWTPDEFVAMQPLVDEITARMQQSFDDIYELHVGNANRSRIERVLNSYWLFWPASYMLKANKWMFRVLTQGAFGRKTNLGGAWTLNELAKEYHERYVRDEDFRKLVDDNDDLLFVLSSILPVAPWSDGVSLNRLTRYVGGHVGLWPQYTNFDPVNVTEWGSKMGQIGPAYSLGLVGDVAKGLAKTVDFQGFDLGNPAQDVQTPQGIPGF